MKYAALTIIIASIGCSHMQSPTAPAAATPAPNVVTYAINVPDQVLAGQLAALHPDGVAVAPVQAQLEWNYSCEYAGTPNVYWGPSAPPQGQYALTGVTVAPASVASELTWTAASWPDEYGRPYGGSSPAATYTWLGRFAYVQPLKPLQPYGACPTRSPR